MRPSRIQVLKAMHQRMLNKPYLDMTDEQFARHSFACKQLYHMIQGAINGEY